MAPSKILEIFIMIKKALVALTSLVGVACTTLSFSSYSQTLNNILVSSKDNLSTTKLEQIINPYLGKEIDLNLLQSILNEISAFYQAQGYLAAQAFYPEQECSDGVIKVVVSAANLHEIKLNNQSKTSQATAYRLINKLQIEQGKAIDSNTINSHLLKLKDLNVVDVSGFFSNYNDSEVNLNLDLTDRTPHAFDIFYDNYGTKSSGEHRLVGIYNGSNLFKLADTTCFYASTTNESQNNFGFDFRLPVNSNLDVAGVSFSYGNYDLADIYEELDANGQMLNLEGLYLSPIYYTSANRVKLGFSPYYKSMKDNFDAFDFHIKKSSFGSKVHLDHNLFLQDLYSQSKFTVNFGKLKYDDNYFGKYPNHNFVFFNLDNQILVPLPYDLSIINHLQVQYSNTYLDASDKFTLGGAYAVKAYQSNLASADIALFDDIKLQHRLNTYSNVYVNFMQAHGKNVDSNRASLYGIGVGGNFNYQGFYLSPSLNTAIGAYQDLAKDDAKFLLKFGYTNI